MTNHKNEAERLLSVGGFSDVENELTLQEAQVQATLHVAEQQRVANLIAWYNILLLTPTADASEIAELQEEITRSIGRTF